MEDERIKYPRHTGGAGMVDILPIIIIILVVVWILLTIATGNPIVALGFISLGILTPILWIMAIIEPTFLGEFLAFGFMSSALGWLLGKCGD